MDSRNRLKFFSIEKPVGPEELKIRGSRFMGFGYPVPDADGATEILGGLRKKYHDATHICSACRFHSPDQEDIRYDDNGEPGGTAGLPIYYEIRRKDYFDVLVVVIRYFGGIKLGTGGLARAYGAAARRVLGKSREVCRMIRSRATVFFPYDFLGDMRRLMERFSVQLVDQLYRSDGVHMVISVPEMYREKMQQMLRDRSRGSITLQDSHDS